MTGDTAGRGEGGEWIVIIRIDQVLVASGSGLAAGGEEKDWNMFFGGSVGDAGLQLDHFIATAEWSDAAVLEFDENVAANGAEVKFSFHFYMFFIRFGAMITYQWIQFEKFSIVP